MLQPRTSFLIILHLLLIIAVPAVALAQAGQLSGHIADPSGEPLPFASVYIQNSTVGTTSNVEGDYQLSLGPGKYQVVFQYVGFETKVVEVTISQQSQKLDVVLEEEAVLLSTVVVRPEEEDPAYGIIRKAIAKRKFYLDQVPAYRCEVYIKGGIKILDAPEKILGQEIGDMAGILDTSTRQGILYLSESESVWNVQRPNKSKEVMISSKVSGNNQGFSFNSAADVNFDLYENTTDYGRPIVSPIAYNAMSYYEYKLLGTVFDEASRMIYKIQLQPKQTELPAYGGVIYIVDGQFNIQGVDVFVTGASLNQPILDTLFLKQVHVPVQKDTWRIFSQTLGLKGNIFGFKFGGNFTSIYRNYDLHPVYPPGFFDNELFKVEAGANEVGLAHFDTIRPLPLTLEESIDYHRRDSLEIVQESKPYLDSLDRESNKFTPMALMTGYTYSRSFAKESFSVESPINTLQFHTVHGIYGHIGLRYRKAFDHYRTKRLETGVKAMYGWAEKRLRLSGNFDYQFNRTHDSRIRLSGGMAAVQFNSEEPISPSINSLYSIYARRNYSKIYDKIFARLDGRHELINGVLLEAGVEYARRLPLFNHSDYSFRKRPDPPYTPNTPIISTPQPQVVLFPEHNALLFDINLRLRIKQQYLSYPGIKLTLDSKWPDIWVRYRTCMAPDSAGNNGIRFHYLSLELEKEAIKMGVAGQSGFYLQTGRFLNNDLVYFMDYRHFNGNQTIFGNPQEYRHRFFLLPYYDYSTVRPHAQAHWEHQFQGYLLDKVPGIRKLGLSSVLSAKALWVEGRPIYWEAALGIDQIGWGLFRILRVDVAAAFSGKDFLDWGVVIGFKLPVNMD